LVEVVTESPEDVLFTIESQRHPAMMADVALARTLGGILVEVTVRQHTPALLSAGRTSTDVTVGLPDLFHRIPECFEEGLSEVEEIVGFRSRHAQTPQERRHIDRCADCLHLLESLFEKSGPIGSTVWVFGAHRSFIE
jgi:hypothetical protein